MKVTITADSTEHALADNDHGGLQLTPSSEMQVLAYLRGANANPVDRGNAMLAVTFSVTKEHASISAASQYALERYADVPRSGLVKFERMEGEVVAFQRYFQDGHVKLVSIVPNGVATAETWQVSGGALLTEEELV